MSGSMVAKWDFGDEHIIHADGNSSGFTAAMIAHCRKCNEHFSAVSSNLYNCKKIIRQKHREHVNERSNRHE